MKRWKELSPPWQLWRFYWVLMAALMALIGFTAVVEGVGKHNTQVAERKAQEQQAARKVTHDILTKAHFKEYRDGIISTVKDAIEAKQWQLAISRSEEYLVSDDLELLRLHNQAYERLSEIAKAKRDERIKIRNLVGTTTKDNPELYEKYGPLDILPGTNNARWIGYYPKGNFTLITNKKTDTIQEVLMGKMSQQELARREEARKKRIEAQFSPWDGSHKNLTKVILAAMNDPDSYGHIDTKYWDYGFDHITVLTTYRGKNAFGGMVKGAVRAKVSLDGQILKIIEQY